MVEFSDFIEDMELIDLQLEGGSIHGSKEMVQRNILNLQIFTLQRMG